MQISVFVLSSVVKNCQRDEYVVQVATNATLILSFRTFKQEFKQVLTNLQTINQAHIPS